MVWNAQICGFVKCCACYLKLVRHKDRTLIISIIYVSCLKPHTVKEMFPIYAILTMMVMIPIMHPLITKINLCRTSPNVLDDSNYDVNHISKKLKTDELDSDNNNTTYKDPRPDPKVFLDSSWK